MTPDQLLLTIAAAQHGCVSTTQARECGLSRQQVQRRRASGRLVRAGPRALTVAGSPPTWEQRLMSALLNLGDDALASHRAAAALHGFDGFPRRPIELTLPRAARNRQSAGRVHTTRRLELIDRTEVEGFRCTTASRTVIDLAASATPRQLERAIDSAVRLGLSSPAYLAERLADLRERGRAGVRLLDRLMVDTGGHSDLERRFLALVRRAGLPRPVCQLAIRNGDGTVARADFAFPPTPVLVEVSGRLGHVSDAERAKDARRRNELQRIGHIVLEFTNRQVRYEPDEVIGTLRAHVT